MSDELERLFLRDEANRAALARGERPRLASSSPWLSLMVGLFLLSIGGLAMSFGASELYAGITLARDGVALEGEVIGRRTTRGDGTRYHLRYAYEHGGQRYEREGRAPEEAWRAACVGCPITLRVAARSPEISRLPDEHPILVGSAVLIFTGMFVVVGGAISASVVMERLARRRLRRAGRVRFGTALEVEDRLDSDNDRCFKVHFQLDEADNILAHRWTDNTPKQTPAPGVRVAVMYVDDEHFELL